MYDTIRFTHTVDPNGHLYMICRCPAFSRCSMQSKCAFLSIAQENHFQREMKSTSQATMISDVVISFIFFAIISSNKNHISVFLRSTNHHRFQRKGFFKENHLFHRSRWRFDIPKPLQPTDTQRYPTPQDPERMPRAEDVLICWPCFLWEAEKSRKNRVLAKKVLENLWHETQFSKPSIHFSMSSIYSFNRPRYLQKG